MSEGYARVGGVRTSLQESFPPRRSRTSMNTFDGNGARNSSSMRSNKVGILVVPIMVCCLPIKVRYGWDIDWLQMTWPDVSVEVRVAATLNIGHAVPMETAGRSCVFRMQILCKLNLEPRNINQLLLIF